VSVRASVATVLALLIGVGAVLGAALLGDRGGGAARRSSSAGDASVPTGANLEKPRHRREVAIRSARRPATTPYERQLNRYLVASVASLGSAILGVFFPPLLLVTLASALYATALILKNGYRAVVHERRLRLDVLGSIYFIASYAGGFFIAGSFGLSAYYLSEKLVLRTQDRSQRSLLNIFEKHPRTAWLAAGDAEVEVPIEQLQAGDVIVVRAGEMVPVDGVVVEGFATIDQHVLTGEGQPAEKEVGDSVLTATLMVAGKMYVRVERTGEETAAAQIVTVLNNTASYQASIVSKGEAVADRSAAPTLVLAAVALPFVGYFYTVTILGSAIGLNIKITGPIAMLNFLNVASKNGVLIKDGRSLELLQDVDTVVFDKTGTLTLDEPHIAEIFSWGGADRDEILRYAAAAEHRQSHPIARAIQAEARARHVEVPAIDAASYEVGYGLTVQMDGRVVKVGSRRFMDREGIELTPDMEVQIDGAQARGHSLVLVAIDAAVAGALEMAPILRPEATEVVARLAERGLDLYIISGDQEDPTREMAEALGIHKFFADTLPEGKSSLIEQLQSEGRSVCFVGDGINDSIALKKANVSMSLRGASTAATDSAQIVLMGEGLRQLPSMFELAHEFNRNMKGGYAVAVGQGVVVISGALLSIVGLISGTAVWLGGLLLGLGIAELPLWRHRLPVAMTTRLELPPGEPSPTQDPKMPEPVS